MVQKKQKTKKPYEFLEADMRFRHRGWRPAKPGLAGLHEQGMEIFEGAMGCSNRE